MTKEQAAALFAKVTAAMIEEDFHNGPAVEIVVPEYRHGWIMDPERGRSWSREEATGEKYDPDQGGWAWV
jgi:hypothetical protein